MDSQESFFIKLQKKHDVLDINVVKGLCVIEKFFEELKIAYSTYDTSEIKNLLAEDFSYNSYFEFLPHIGKETYLQLLELKFKEMKYANHNEKLEHLYNSDTGEQILIFVDRPIGNKGEYVCFVATSDAKGLIKKLTLTASTFYDALFIPKETIQDFLSMEI